MTTLYKNIESSTADPNVVEEKQVQPTQTAIMPSILVACGLSGRKDKTTKKITYRIIIAILIVVLLTMLLKPQNESLVDQIEGFADTAMTLGKKIAWSLRH